MLRSDRAVRSSRRPSLRSFAVPFSVFIALFIAPQAARAQKVATCVDCINEITCAEVSSTGALGCTVKPGQGCRLDLSFCIIAMNRATTDLRLRPEEMLKVQEGETQLALAPVGEGRYAAWNCSGQLIRLVEKRADGGVRALSVAQFRDRYAYWRLTAQAASRGPRAASNS